jgi:septal ring factor EnvC (AmiA/AmiB activator)
MWLLNPKKLLFISLLLLLFLPQVFSQGVYLTESEFQELLNIIKTSKTNSETQTRLIEDLKNVLAKQEAELQQALNSLEQSETDLAELKASLSRIRTYSDELNKYCLTLEQENAALKNKNMGLKIGLGISSGAAVTLIAVLLILLL